jgi:hypothetical protein
MKHMHISEFTHEGTAYVIEPPVEIGDYAVEASDLVGLIAVAQVGVEATDQNLGVARLTAALVLKNSVGSLPDIMNALLQDRHHVSVAGDAQSQA